MSLKEKNDIFDRLVQDMIENNINNYNINKFLKKYDIKQKEFYYFFPKKIDDLCVFYFENITLKASKQVARKISIEKSISKRVNYLLKSFILLLDKEKKLVLYFLNFLSSKPLLFKKISLKYADSIWVKLKDNSTDFNFYTKRFTLSIILINTLIYWRGSMSKEQTFSFIDKQIFSLGKFGYYKMLLKKFLKKIPFKKSLSNFDFFHKS